MEIITSGLSENVHFWSCLKHGPNLDTAPKSLTYHDLAASTAAASGQGPVVETCPGWPPAGTQCTGKQSF
jgi:hypothetical protein